MVGACRRSIVVRSSRPRALDPDRARAVDHDLGDLGVGEQRFERTEAADVGQHLSHQSLPALAPRQRRLLAHEIGDVTLEGAAPAFGHQAGVRPGAEGGAHAASVPSASRAERSARSSPRGRRPASRPASTARATAGSTRSSARTGTPSTSSTSDRAE